MIDPAHLITQLGGAATGAQLQRLGLSRTTLSRHVAKGITVRDAVIDLGYVERGELTLEQLDEKLDLLSMTHAG